MSYPALCNSRTSALPCLLGLAILALSGTARAEGLDAKERKSVVEGIARELGATYVSAEVGKQCGDHLLAELGRGAYDKLAEPSTFAATLTEALQGISNDKHMRVMARNPRRAQTEREDPVVARLQERDRMRRANYGFERVEILDGNVGYVDMRSFSPLNATRDTAVAAMAFVANTDAIIFDMRYNGGGSPSTVQFVCSYFFEERTHLNSLYWRANDETQEFWTLDEVPGKRLPDVPLFVLTSGRTFSGAEEFTYNLRTRERATIVGETTGGGANPGGRVNIDERFTIFIPVGRAVNPITGTNWEGVGVEPHISVPASSALDRAHKEARKSARMFRQSRNKWISNLRDDISDRLSAAEELFEDEVPAEGTKAVEAALRLGRNSDVLEEVSINTLGHECLQNGSFEVSIAIFRFNVDEFPESSNAWDSLGEGYMENADYALAIKSYEKALKLDPDNENAAQMIGRLKEKK